MPQTHELKTHSRYFQAIKRGEKTFEVRRNDRAFQTGDILKLIETDDNGRFLAAWPDPPDHLLYRVSYLLQGGQFGIEPGYCVMGLAPVSADAS